jgi:hypothetical protein
MGEPPVKTITTIHAVGRLIESACLALWLLGSALLAAPRPVYQWVRNVEGFGNIASDGEGQYRPRRAWISRKPVDFLRESAADCRGEFKDLG